MDAEEYAFRSGLAGAGSKNTFRFQSHGRRLKRAEEQIARRVRADAERGDAVELVSRGALRLDAEWKR